MILYLHFHHKIRKSEEKSYKSSSTRRLEEGRVGVGHVNREILLVFFQHVDHLPPELCLLLLVQDWPAVSELHLCSVLTEETKEEEENLLESYWVGIVKHCGGEGNRGVMVSKA